MRSHHLRAAGGGSSLDDAAYSEFFTSGASPLNFQNSSYDVTSGTKNSVPNGVHNGSDVFFDHSAQKIWSGLKLGSIGAGYYTWNNGGNTYADNANFYRINSTHTNLSGYSDAQADNYDGKGLTIAYLQDNTPVIVTIGSNTSSKALHFFDYPDGTYIGYLNISISGTGQPPSSNFYGGICYSGTHLITQKRNEQYLWGYELPTNKAAIDSSSTISAVLRWDLGSSAYADHSIAWGGGNRVYIARNSTTAAVYQFLLSDNGFSGTSSMVRTYGAEKTNYSVAIDYKNRELIVGGYWTDTANATNWHRVYGE